MLDRRVKLLSTKIVHNYDDELPNYCNILKFQKNQNAK
jgi:hypothetical protein